MDATTVAPAGEPRAEFTDPVGATPGELACLPGLLLDLCTSLLPRRLALAHGLLALLGGSTADKVRSRLEDLEYHRRQMIAGYSGEPTKRYHHARELAASIAKLEDSLFGLVSGRLRKCHQLVPVMLSTDSAA